MSHISAKEVDSNGGLCGKGVTLLAVSNQSLTKRSIIDVFPTPISPKNTILNLISQREVLSSVLIQNYYKKTKNSKKYQTSYFLISFCYSLLSLRFKLEVHFFQLLLLCNQNIMHFLKVYLLALEISPFFFYCAFMLFPSKLFRRLRFFDGKIFSYAANFPYTLATQLFS